MRTWLDSVNGHQNTVTATIQLENPSMVHSQRRLHKHYLPPLVPLSDMRINFDSPQIFLDCVGYQQYYKSANCPTFGGSVSLFELAKVKKEGQFHFLEISVMANFTV